MKIKSILLLVLAVIVVTVAVTALLVNIFEHKQEEKTSYFRVAAIPDLEPDPAVWGRNFPAQYEAYGKTMHTGEMIQYSRYGRFGGSEASSKLDRYSDTRRLFAGYAFAIEYNEERGHLRAVEDARNSKRLGDKKPGACMTCKSSQVPGIMKEIGPDAFYAKGFNQLIADHGIRHAIACADCHDAATMSLTISRPAFREAMGRRGVNLAEASLQQMRTYVCAQCHVEYYFKGTEKYLTFPWENGLTVENIEAYYDGIGFQDWTHAESGAAMVKIQHPEFELWSTGIHARAGVACADCHMPYMRQGAVKITDHWIRTPLAAPETACAGCHPLAGEELRGRVLEIQDRTYHLMQKSEKAIIAALDAIREALGKGASAAALDSARDLHRRASLRWDFISAENSMGFHSPQESVRILGDAVDLARQAQIAAIRAIPAK